MNTEQTTNQTVTQNLSDADIKGLSFNDAMEKIRAELILDPTQQFKSGGKLYQRVAKFRPHGKGLVFVSIVVDHTPNSKYTGAKLREIRANQAKGA